MAHVRWSDVYRYFLLSDVILPERDEVIAAAPRNPIDLRRDRFDELKSSEDALAWVLSTLPRQRAYYRRLHGCKLNAPCDTWVLSAPDTADGALATWFGDTPDDMRITIQATPRYRLGIGTWPDLTHPTFRDQRLRLQSHYSSRSLPTSAAESARRVLIDLSDAYREFDETSDNSNVQGFIDSLDHPYSHSQGLVVSA